MKDESGGGLQETGRRDLVRDVAVLQVKLLVDGLRDVILVPASLVAGLISLAKFENGEPGPEFYSLLGAGKRSERWINLFGAHKKGPSRADDVDGPADTDTDMDIDRLVSRVESYVVDEYRRGDITAQAKAKIDQALDAIQRRSKEDK